MTKAKRNMEADHKLVDMLIELLDARCPEATANPDIRKLSAGKERLVLLNKADLADEAVTGLWIDHFKAQGIKAIALDSRKRDAAERIHKAAENLISAKRERDRARGITGLRPIKAMICGIPNVGKSTFINSVNGKTSARTGNRPGVTRGNQWINVNNELMFLDTPGVLWPRFESRETDVCLAEIGSINDQVIQQEELSIELLDFLLGNYRGCLFERYSISSEEFEKAAEDTVSEVLGVKTEPLAMLNLISAKRGCLKKGGVPDYEKAARLVIDDFRSGRLGRISLQKP